MKTVTLPMELEVRIEELQAGVSIPIPLVGWHNPWADIEHEGKEYKIQIVHGCRSIWLSDKKGNVSIVEIGDIVPLMIEALRKVKK